MEIAGRGGGGVLVLIKYILQSVVEDLCLKFHRHKLDIGYVCSTWSCIFIESDHKFVCKG